MRIDASQSPHLFELARVRLDSHLRPELGHRVITGLGTDRILCQAVFTDVVAGVRCELSIWADHAARGLAGRHFLRQVFNVAFNQWDCQRVSAVIRESNRRSQDAALAMGFKFEAPLAGWYGAEDGWMFRMLRRDCRWITH